MYKGQFSKVSVDSFAKIMGKSSMDLTFHSPEPEFDGFKARSRSLSTPSQLLEDSELRTSIENIFSLSELEDPQSPLYEMRSDPVDDNIWNEKGTVIFGEHSGRTVVKAGNVNQLILHYTTAVSDKSNNSEFADTFIITLQTFIKPIQFLRKLLERYNVPPCPGDQDQEEYEKSLKIPVQLRVIKVLKKWVTSRYYQDFNGNHLLMEEFLHFIDHVLNADHPQAASNLTNALNSAIGEHQAFMENNQSIISSSETEFDGYLGFDSMLTFDTRELAAQMTLIDAENFKSIRLHEFVDQAWSKSKKNAPYIIRAINHSNRVANWVAFSILSEPSHKNRVRILVNMISLLSYLKSYRNYSGIMAVLSGLSSSSISRLKNLFQDLPSKYHKILQGLNEMMRSVSSFKAYREALKSGSGPCIPFLGVILTDLTFLEDGNPSTTKDGLINWQKRLFYAQFLTEFTNQQLFCRYQIQESVMKAGFVKRVQDSQISAEELYEMSLKIQPRISKDDKPKK